MKGFLPVEPQRLYRTIAEQIASKIVAGELKVGDRLPAERDLAEKLGVSRSSIREALIALEIEGHIEVRVGSGIFICADRIKRGDPKEEPVAEDMSPFDLLETRMLIEPRCAALAAQNGTPDQIEQIRRTQKDMMRGSSNVSQVPPHAQDRAFHIAIAVASGNAALLAAVTHLWDLSDRSQMYRKLQSHFLSEHVWKLADDEHRRIASAVIDRDPTLAHNAMMGHLINIGNRLRDEITEETVERGRRKARVERNSQRPT